MRISHTNCKVVVQRSRLSACATSVTTLNLILTRFAEAPRVFAITCQQSNNEAFSGESSRF